MSKEDQSQEGYESQRLMSEHQNLTNELVSEYDLCLILGISGDTLGRLRRQRNFPYVPLDTRNRVYIIPEVLKWLKEAQRV